MRSSTLKLAMFSALAINAALAAQAGAQQATQPSSTAPPATAPSTMPPAATAPATRSSDAAQSERRNEVVSASTLESGANSFTEGQARSRFEDAGITAIEGLRKDDQGFWRGRGTHGGTPGDIALDFRGRIAVGPGVATIPSASLSPTAADGTPGNPPGTAAGRAIDRATGSNATGTNPAGGGAAPAR